ncbi:MAG: zf-HC2 domain-containing protein [Aquabacterium sp.]
MKNCREVTRLFSEGLERPLSLGERAHLKFHCMMCGACRNFGDHMQDLRQIARRFAKDGDSSAQVDSGPTQRLGQT